MKTNFFSTALMCASFLILSSCSGPRDADKIADAQNCLDNATPAEAPTCVEKVDGIESPSAYLIRCAGKFVKEGFSEPAKLASTMEGMNGDDSGSEGSTSMMAAMAFKSEASIALNAASATETLEYCKKSLSKGLITLSALTSTSTNVAKLAYDLNNAIDVNNMDGDDLKTYMGQLQNDPAAQAAVGSAVAAIYTASCANGGQTAGEFCEQFEAAAEAAGGIENTSQLGQTIMKCYSNPALPECAAFQ